MQFSRYLTYHKSRAQLSVWVWVLKAILAAASFYYIIAKLIEEQVIFSVLGELFSSIQFVFLFLGVSVLMILNWMLESKKWQLIAKEHQTISLLEAFKAILTGVSLDAILPFGSGAVGSKVLSLNGAGRQQLIAPIILAQGIQSFWTMMFGTIGLYQLAYLTDIIAMYGGLKSILPIALIGILLIVAILKFWPNTIKSIIYSVKKLPQLVWIKVVVVSLIRYLVFFTQLLILSTYMAPEVPVDVLIGCVTWMFFAKTIVPKPGHLGAVGIRGAAVVFFLSLAGYAYSAVVLATLVLWFINLAIPSMVGLFFMKDLNLKTDIQE